jgi:hypothetical protein
MQTLFQQNPNRLFFITAAVYCVLWFLLPLLVQKNLRPDSVEQFFIGKEWSVSTTKHPTLPAALLETAFFLTGNVPECTYLVSALAVFVMLWSIWQVSKVFLPPHLALLAVFAGCNYRCLNIGSTYFHNSVGILPFWTLTVLFFYHALKTGQYRYWILAGITTGCGLQCKYPMILLAAVCFLFVLTFKETRKKYRTKLCLTTLIAFLIFFPHILWNFQHGFPTLDYLAKSGKTADMSIAGHLINPAAFLASQFALLLPVLLSVYPVLHFKRKQELNAPAAHNKTGRQNWEHWFLAFIVIVPVLLQIAQCVYSGHKMRAGLGTHLWLFFVPCLLYYLPATSETFKLRRAFCNTAIIAVMTAAIFAGYWLVQPFVSKGTNDTLFPGRQLAEKVERIWHEKFDVPIPYATGEWLLAGNVALYGKDRPSVLAFGGNSYFGTKMRNITPWTEPKDVRENGGVILWQISDEQNPVPEDLYSDYPDAEVLMPFEIYPQTRAKKPPVKIGIALVSPK